MSLMSFSIVFILRGKRGHGAKNRVSRCVSGSRSQGYWVVSAYLSMVVLSSVKLVSRLGLVRLVENIAVRTADLNFLRVIAFWWSLRSR